MFVTTNPALYANTTGWVESIGPYWLTFVEPTATGDGHERRVLFEGALDMDFVPVPVEAFAAAPSAADLDMVRRGVRVVLDKDGAISRALQDITLPDAVAQPPEESAYLNCYDFGIMRSGRQKAGAVSYGRQLVYQQVHEMAVCAADADVARAAHGWKLMPG
jgi:hypothetical protein